MKSKVLRILAVCAFACTLTVPSAMADHGFGAEDSRHVWHDADYWHARHPDWMYSHHPEWAVDRRDWWFADHRDHPGWFSSPFWHSYPIWLWGAPYGGVWRDYGWWHQYHPDWMYAHHPEWAEPYGRWQREDHGRHPEWFRSAYWRDHPRDWANPDKEFWRHEDDRFKKYVKDHPEDRYKSDGGSHGNSTYIRNNADGGQKGSSQPPPPRLVKQPIQPPSQPKSLVSGGVNLTHPGGATSGGGVATKK